MKLENAPLNLVNLFEKSLLPLSRVTHDYTSENLFVKRSRLQMQKYSFSPFGVTLWNEISPCVQYVSRQYLVLPRFALTMSKASRSSKFYSSYFIKG